MTNLDSILKSRDSTLAPKVRQVKAMVFPVVMYRVRVGLWRKLSFGELMLLNCGVEEDSWESLGLQGDQTSQTYRKSVLNIHWRTDVEAPIHWPPDVKNWLIGKDPDAGKDWRQEEKSMTEDETVGWHHWLDGHEFEQTLGVGDGQGSLTCCNPWGHMDWTPLSELNWTRGSHSSCNSSSSSTLYQIYLYFSLTVDSK